MGHAKGTGFLLVGTPTFSNVSAHRSKEIISSSGDLKTDSNINGFGISYANGVILSYVTYLYTNKCTCSGTGKTDNLYGLPRLYIDARFNVNPTYLEARFPNG